MKSIIKIEDDLIRLEQAALFHRNAAEEMKKEFFDNNGQQPFSQYAGLMTKYWG